MSRFACKNEINVEQKKKSFFRSGIENENDIYSCAQLEAAAACKAVDKVKTEVSVIVVGGAITSSSDAKVVESISTPIRAEAVEPKLLTPPPKRAVVINKPQKELSPPRPRSVTASVFVPVTEIPAALLALQQQQQLPSAVPHYPHQHQRPQTVTASVFAPLSAQRKQYKSAVQQQQQPSSAAIVPPTNKLVVPVVSSAAPPVQSLQNTMNKGYLMFLEEGSDLTSKFWFFIFAIKNMLLQVFQKKKI